MSYVDLVISELNQAQSVLDAFLKSKENIVKIRLAAEMIADSILTDGKIISCGNGGSHCDAMHFAEELTGRFRDNRRSMAAIAISDPSFITCAGNDFGYDFIFSRFVEGVGSEGDILLGLSTSGNSKNVINAVSAAKNKGMKSIVLTGNDGGKLGKVADLEIRVPHKGYADRIQEVHIKIIHTIILLVEKIVEEGE